MRTDGASGDSFCCEGGTLISAKSNRMSSFRRNTKLNTSSFLNTKYTLGFSPAASGYRFGLGVNSLIENLSAAELSRCVFDVKTPFFCDAIMAKIYCRDIDVNRNKMLFHLNVERRPTQPLIV